MSSGRSHPNFHVEIPNSYPKSNKSSSSPRSPTAQSGRLDTPYPVLDQRVSPDFMTASSSSPTSSYKFPTRWGPNGPVRTPSVGTISIAGPPRSPSAQDMLLPIVSYGQQQFQQQADEAKQRRAVWRAKREALDSLLGTEIPEYSSSVLPTRKGSGSTSGSLSMTSSRASMESNESHERVSVVDFANAKR